MKKAMRGVGVACVLAGLAGVYAGGVAQAKAPSLASQNLSVSGEINTTPTPATESFAALVAEEQLPVQNGLVEPTKTATRGPFGKGVAPELVSPGVPTRVTIPSIGLNAPVIRVGLNSKGEMDVPDGNTNNVGWWQGGTLPGAVGSAVLDAHVFAALKNLHKARVGDDIYIDTGEGQLHFVVEESVVYELADVPRETLFNRADQARLNLITCEGTYDPARDTYTHRRVVYAVRVP